MESFKLSTVCNDRKLVCSTITVITFNGLSSCPHGEMFYFPTYWISKALKAEQAKVNKPIRPEPNIMMVRCFLQ